VSNFTFSPGIYRMLCEALAGAEREQHRTVWWQGTATIGDKDDDALFFMTFNGETARKAKAALEAVGVLCEEMLGTLASDGSGRIEPPVAITRCSDCGGALLKVSWWDTGSRCIACCFDVPGAQP